MKDKGVVRAALGQTSRISRKADEIWFMITVFGVRCGWD
jgi:hypothetical protein